VSVGEERVCPKEAAAAIADGIGAGGAGQLHACREERLVGPTDPTLQTPALEVSGSARGPMPAAPCDGSSGSEDGVGGAAGSCTGGQFEGLASPTACRHCLAVRLRQLREAAGLTGQQLAEASGVARQVISEGENAQRVLTVRDVYRLLAALGDTGEIRQLTGLASRAAAAGWWACYAPVLDARQCLHTDLEGGAAQVQVYCQVGLPEVFHTPGYAQHRAGLRSQTMSPRRAAEAVEATMVRQQLLWAGGVDCPAVDYQAVVEESVLRRLWAPPPALREQLNNLASRAETGRLRVLPADARLQEPPTTSFALYSYARSCASPCTSPWTSSCVEADPMRLVAVDADTGDRVFHDRDRLDPYQQQYAGVAAAALSPADSAALVGGLPTDGLL
jgi:transcriptional regulator with XRE-family HTH domain